jgi:hypothetical protein
MGERRRIGWDELALKRITALSEIGHGTRG